MSDMNEGVEMEEVAQPESGGKNAEAAGREIGEADATQARKTTNSIEADIATAIEGQTGSIVADIAAATEKATSYRVQSWIVKYGTSGALTVARSADSEWGTFRDGCFREEETNGRKNCVDMYGNLSEDESITVAEINKDFKVIDPQLNKADSKQDADGRRVRFAKLLDKSIDQSEKYSWIRLDDLPMYDDKGLVDDFKRRLDLIAALLFVRYHLRVIPIWKSEIEMDWMYAGITSSNQGMYLGRIFLPVNIELTRQSENDWQTPTSITPQSFTRSATLRQFEVKSRQRRFAGFLYSGEAVNFTAIGSPMAFMDLEQTVKECGNGGSDFVETTKLIETYGKRAVMLAAEEAIDKKYDDMEEEEKILLPRESIQFFYTKIGYGTKGRHYEQSSQQENKSQREAICVYGPVELDSRVLFRSFFPRLTLRLTKFSWNQHQTRPIAIVAEMMEPNKETVTMYNGSSYERRVAIEQDLNAVLRRPINMAEYEKAAKGVRFICGADVAILVEGFVGGSLDVPRIMSSIHNTSMRDDWKKSDRTSVTKIIDLNACPEQHYNSINYHEGFVRGYEGLKGTWGKEDRGILVLTDPALVDVVVQCIKRNNRDHVNTAKRLNDTNGFEAGSFKFRDDLRNFMRDRKNKARPCMQEYATMLNSIKKGEATREELRYGDERKMKKRGSETAAKLQALMRGDAGATMLPALAAATGGSSHADPLAGLVNAAISQVMREEGNTAYDRRKNQKKKRMQDHAKQDLLKEASAKAALIYATKALTADEQQSMAKLIAEAAKEGRAKGEEIRQATQNRMVELAVTQVAEQSAAESAHSPSKRGKHAHAASPSTGRNSGRVRFNTSGTSRAGSGVSVTATVTKRIRSPTKQSPGGRQSKARSTDENTPCVQGDLLGKMQAAGDGVAEAAGLTGIGIDLDMQDLPSITPAPKQPTEQGMTRTDKCLTPTIPQSKREANETDDNAAAAMKAFNVNEKMMAFYKKKSGDGKTETGKREFLKRRQIWEDSTYDDLESMEWQVADGECVLAQGPSSSKCSVGDFCSHCYKRVEASKAHQIRIAYALQCNENEEFENKVSLRSRCFSTNVRFIIVNIGLKTDDASLLPSQLWRPPG
jgi:hypothetical protein